jgi:hypothetical protein
MEPAISNDRTYDKRNNGLWSASGGGLVQSELASYQAECLRLRRERDSHVRDVDDHVNELSRTRRQMQALECQNDVLMDRLSAFDRQDQPARLQLEQLITPERNAVVADVADIDVAVHAAALNVAVRAELEAARKSEERVVQVAEKEALNSRAHDNSRGERRVQVLQEASDMRMWNLSSELQAEKAFSNEAEKALQDSMRALREQEQLADGLRSKLDMATTSCAAARAARASVAKRAQRNNKVSAVEALAGFAIKPLYRNSSTRDRSSERSSNLRSRIEEEARLRMSLGLCGLTA